MPNISPMSAFTLARLQTGRSPVCDSHRGRLHDRNHDHAPPHLAVPKEFGAYGFHHWIADQRLTSKHRTAKSGWLNAREGALIAAPFWRLVVEHAAPLGVRSLMCRCDTRRPISGQQNGPVLIARANASGDCAEEGKQDIA
jgi:hypothetical protein